MKVLIVEDETAAYENLTDILTEITPDIRIMANTESVTQTVGWLQSNPAPDLIFMDIHGRNTSFTGGRVAWPKAQLCLEGKCLESAFFYRSPSAVSSPRRVTASVK